MSHRIRTSRHDELLREAYGAATQRRALSRELDRIMALPEFAGVKRCTALTWACELGLSRKMSYGRHPWIPGTEETILLEKWAGEIDTAAIQKRLQRRGYSRSMESIFAQIRKMRISRRPDIYSLREVGAALRCDDDCVARLIRHGYLKGKISEVQGKSALIRPMDLAEFFVRHPEVADKYRPDIPFLVALILEWSHSRRGANGNGREISNV